MYSSHSGVPDGAKSATTCMTSLYEIILADFNFAVSTPTTKLPNLIPRQILPAIQQYQMLRGTIQSEPAIECLNFHFTLCILMQECTSTRQWSSPHVIATQIGEHLRSTLSRILRRSDHLEPLRSDALPKHRPTKGKHIYVYSATNLVRTVT